MKETVLHIILVFSDESNSLEKSAGVENLNLLCSLYIY